MYVFGGWDETKNEMRDLWEFRVRTATWSKLPDGFGGPSARTGAVLVAQPQMDRLLLFGGCDAKQPFGDLFEYKLPHHRSSSSSRGDSARGDGTDRKSSRSHRHHKDKEEKEEKKEGGEEPQPSERAHSSRGSSTNLKGFGWSKVEMSGLPPPKRSNHVMLPGGGGKTVLVFGGFDGNGFLGDLTQAVLE